jgi:hypothetical protein
MKYSQDRQLHNGRTLFEKVRETEAEIPGVAPYRKVLEKAHTQAVSAKSQRKALDAASREATRQLNEDLAAFKDAASALRSYIRGVLGPRNPKLGSYGIKPLRRRSVGKPRCES